MTKATSTAQEPALPRTPEEVTADWLSACLGHRVKSFEFGENMLLATASKLFPTLKYEDEREVGTPSKPRHLCIKGGFNPALIAQYSGILVRMYQREVDFFSRVAPTLKHIDLLRCYWAGRDDAQGIVLLDDLRRLGMRFGEPTEAWPVSRVLLGVEQLAGLHAGTWGVDNERDYPWLADPQHYDRTILDMCSWWQPLVVGEKRAHFPANWDEARMTAVIKKHFSSRDPRFRCLTHGDPHLGNTFVTPDGQPRFLDWQVIHVASAFHDVAYFVIGALAPADRRESEMKILRHYLDCLARFGGPRLEVNDVLVEYRKSMLSGVGWMLTPYNLQSKERVEAMSERYGSAIVEHKVMELVESLP